VCPLYISRPRVIHGLLSLWHRAPRQHWCAPAAGLNLHVQRNYDPVEGAHTQAIHPDRSQCSPGVALVTFSPSAANPAPPQGPGALELETQAPLRPTNRVSSAAASSPCLSSARWMMRTAPADRETAAVSHPDQISLPYGDEWAVHQRLEHM
jgi:hypothetical protein